MAQDEGEDAGAARAQIYLRPCLAVGETTLAPALRPVLPVRSSPSLYTAAPHSGAACRPRMRAVTVARPLACLVTPRCSRPRAVRVPRRAARPPARAQAACAAAADGQLDAEPSQERQSARPAAGIWKQTLVDEVAGTSVSGGATSAVAAEQAAQDEQCVASPGAVCVPCSPWCLLQGQACRSRLSRSAFQARAGAPCTRPEVRSHALRLRLLRRLLTVCAAPPQRHCSRALCLRVERLPLGARWCGLPARRTRREGATETDLAEAIFSDMLRASPLASFVEARARLPCIETPR